MTNVYIILQVSRFFVYEKMWKIVYFSGTFLELKYQLNLKFRFAIVKIP